MKNNVQDDAQEKFLRRYREDIPMYQAWGDYVQKKIYENLHMSEEEISKIIKVKSEPRVKGTNSIIAKAFFRKEKNYENAYEEITDKVGIRFVVMVDKQITIIKKIIENTTIWTFSKDQDYEEARKENPSIFGYQSVHYVVRNAYNISENGISIIEGIPCEIQIRTLEQHAYAELSHDYVYKSQKTIESETKRFLARSMALNETTDELFSRVYEMMENENRKYYDLTKFLQSKLEFKNFNDKINRSIYDCIESMIEKYSVGKIEIDQFINNYYIDNIEKRQNKIVYQQPMIIMIYYLARNYEAELQEKWNFTQEMLVMIFSDLGIQSNDVY